MSRRLGVLISGRGSNLQSTFARETTKVAQGPVIDAKHDPSISFDGWAEWDGTSFSTPIAAAMIARTMTRTGIYYAPDAAYKLRQNSSSAALAVDATALIDAPRASKVEPKHPPLAPRPAFGAAASRGRTGASAVWS